MEAMEYLVPAVFVLCSILFGVGGLYFGVRRTKRQRERAERAALELGLDFSSGEEAILAAYGGKEGDPSLKLWEKQPAFLKKLFSALGPWRLVGKRDGIDVAVYEETRSSGKSSTTYTVVRAYYPEPLPFELRVAKEGFFAKVGKSLFGLQDVEIGDPEFDTEFRVKTGDPLQAKLRLDRPETKRAFLEALRAYPAFRAERAFVHYERVGIHTDAEELRPVLGLLVPAARALGEGD